MNLVDRIPTKVLEKACAVLAARKAKGRRGETFRLPPQQAKAASVVVVALKPGTPLSGDPPELDPRIKLNTWIVTSPEPSGPPGWGGFATERDAENWAKRKFGKRAWEDDYHWLQVTTKRKRDVAKWKAER